MTSAPAVTHGAIDIGNGVQLYYETCGTGTPIVFVHGLWGSSRFFRRQLEHFGADHHAIAVDLRGHGRSSMTLSDQTVPSYARDLEVFLTRLDLQQVVAVGWSMGAFVWWDHFRQFGPSRLRGLVVVDQPPSDLRSAAFPDGLITIEMLSDWHYRVQTDRVAFMNEVLPTMFATPPAATEHERLVDEMLSAPEVIAAAVLFDQSTRDYRQMLEGYPVPTLVCTGARSAQPRTGMQRVVDAVVNGRLVVFEGCGHALFIEDPVRFNATVGEFIDALPVA